MENFKNKNIIAIILKVISFLCLFGGILLSFATDTTTDYIIFIVGGILSFSLLFGFGEIIQLLEDIKNK